VSKDRGHDREAQEALVSAYALGALDPDESARAEELVRSSEDLRLVFEEALETAVLLALATFGGPLPDDLRSRIVQAARADGEPGRGG
jgi:anti-sigma-K factor RskA